MDSLDQVLKQLTGAKFYRADLHIHTFGGSHDVSDSTMTVGAIVATAEREGLHCISITDHNEIANVQAAVEAAAKTDICVIPGIELSTPQGHILCYLPTLEALQRFHGQLSIVDRGTERSRCQQAIHECLNILSGLRGFGILAHVDIPSGFEVQMPGASPHKVDVLCHPSLRGIEVKRATSAITYSETDTDPNRANMGRERIRRLSLGSKQFLARVLNSDAHALVSLGRNAENAKRVTRYKMDVLCFEGLRIALEDADARVRIEDQIPQTVPQVLGLHIAGGFLTGQTIRFNPNLNCIIGGRGTGKSTTFEAVRCLMGGKSDCKVVDSEVWPDELHLFWQDEIGQKHSLCRAKDGDVENIDDPDLGPCRFEMDSFGQGDAARISIEAHTNPLVLLKYLDRFIELKEAEKAEEDARDELLSLQTDIEKAEEKVKLIPQHERQLSTTKQQLTALQKSDVKDLIDLQRKVATERELRNQIRTAIEGAKTNVERSSPKEAIHGIRDLALPATLSVGATEFQAIVNSASSFEEVCDSAETNVKNALTSLDQIITAQMSSWKLKEAEAQKRIEAKRSELEALNIVFDLSYITKLARDEASQDQSVKALKTWKPHLDELRKKRQHCLDERWKARSRIGMLRNAFGRKATEVLAESLSDLKVSLKYSESAYSPDAETQIIEAMGWRTNQQVRANYLIEHLTVPLLLDAIQRKDTKSITSLKTREGVEYFKRDEAEQIIERLSEPPFKFALERAKLYDLPRLQVTRAVPDGKGGLRYVHRDFSKLSLGQQQSILLALILSADSDRPLVIDQPEDNLDGEFIYSTLVPVLRRAKERRQVIIVTHNANVAVLSDAELIVVMKAFNDRGEIVSRGSIDHPDTREAALSILEGAKEAFLRRAKMYGVPVG